MADGIPGTGAPAPRRRCDPRPPGRLAIAVCCLLLGCSEDTSRLVVGVDRVHLDDPRVVSEQASSRVFHVILNGLVSLDSRGGLIPELAERWESLDGGRRYRFHLRTGVRFHDGRPLAARDVVWTFGSILDDPASPKRATLKPLEEVREIDYRTVDFVLREPSVVFLRYLTSDLGVIPYGTSPEDFRRETIGSGPFRLHEKTPGRLEFRRFERYWGEPAGVEVLVYMAPPLAPDHVTGLLEEEIDLVVDDLPPERVAEFRRRSEDFNVLEAAGSKYVYIGFNHRHPALRRPEVRRAIDLAIDREKLARDIWLGLAEASGSALPAGHWARHPRLGAPLFDREEASRLLDAAKYPDPDGPEGPQTRLSLRFSTSKDPISVAQAHAIAGMLGEVGVEISVHSVGRNALFNKLDAGDFELYSLVQTGAADPDIYRLTLHSEARLNRGGYTNAGLDRLLQEGLRIADLEARRRHYEEVQRIVADECPIAILLHKKSFAVVAAGLEGFEIYPSGEFFALRKVRWSG